jgi:hypothetical protein
MLLADLCEIWAALTSYRGLPHKWNGQFCGIGRGYGEIVFIGVLG